MHPYATDSSRNTTAIVVMTTMSILSAWLLSKSFDGLGLSTPWWLDTPAVLGFFGIYWKLYDRCSWKWNLLGFHLSEVPDLSGIWKGTVQGSHPTGDDTTVKVTIHQTATRILVCLEGDHSTSASVMAVLNCQPGVYQGLTYLYENWPRTNAPDGMTPHRGRVTLALSDANTLTGEYSNDWHRATAGKMELHREESS